MIKPIDRNRDELARDLGLQAGDKLRLDAGEGREAVVDVAGIFELEVRELDARYVYLDLKQAQTLLDLPGGVTAIDTTVDAIFDAESIAARLGRLTGLKAESWMASNGQLLNALRSQTMTTQMIRLFVGLRLFGQRCRADCSQFDTVAVG
jgi:lipoprotein-releasing system permease protein